MASINAITGITDVIKNLKMRNAQLGAAFNRGVRKAGLKLQRESMLKVPVDLVNLKPSAYTRATGKGFDTVVNVGYTALYALYVHEAVEMKLKGQPRPKGHKGRYWDPQGRGQAKFLEEPARTLAPELRSIIKKEMQIN